MYLAVNTLEHNSESAFKASSRTRANGRGEQFLSQESTGSERGRGSQEIGLSYIAHKFLASATNTYEPVSSTFAQTVPIARHSRK